MFQNYGNPSEEHHQRLLTLLGMNDMPSLTAATPLPLPATSSAGAGSRAAPRHPSATLRVGQRGPHRDPVGAVVPPAKPALCPGSGALDLDAHRLTHAAVAHVECPLCGAVRTAKLKAQRVVIPVHTPLKTHTTRKGARWSKGETGWALSQS